jgi:hypothetical protein
VFLGVALVATSAPIVAFEVLYRYGLWLRGSVPSLPATSVPTRAVTVLWAIEETDKPGRFLWAGNYFDRGVKREGAAAVAAVAPGNAQAGRQLERNLAEAAYAVWLSRHASVHELASAFAEWTWFGHGARGLEAAARIYFGKNAAALSLGELALLSGLPQAPSAYDPACHADRARKRRSYVLRQLETAGLIDTTERVAAAEQEPITVLPKCGE